VGATAAVSVAELDLPYVDLVGVERADALAAVDAARRQHWLARTPLGYLVTGYDDAVAILRDRRFHSALAVVPMLAGVPEDGLRRRRSILSVEGAEHDRLRRLVAPAFTPAAAERLRPAMGRIIDGLLDQVASRGAADLVPTVCEPYPIPVICELLGAPADDWERFSRWATDVFAIFNGTVADDLPRIRAALDELDAYVGDLIAERRLAPRPDLLSDLIAIEEAGDRLSTDELVMLAEAVLLAGTDTTRNQLACSVALLLEHPDQWALLVERPELAPRVVEETMRYLGAVRGTGRFAAEDVVYRGVCFPAGTLVAVSLAGANRDPAVFDAPDVLDVTAERSAVQLTFGSGIHHCLGAALARAELAEALPRIARRLPGLRPDGPVTWKPPTHGIWGPASLPVRWDPVGADEGRSDACG
jgi:cytochrome P450